MAEDAEKLAGRCNEAFDLYRHDCSHAVWHVIRLYKPDQPYMQANALVSHLSRSTEWIEISLSELSRLANQGALVVGGLQETGHGHVIVVYPGAEKPKGGFYFTSREGERQFAAPAGMYARAMSTSFSRNPYPGTISRGDSQRSVACKEVSAGEVLALCRQSVSTFDDTEGECKAVSGSVTRNMDITNEYYILCTAE